MSNKNSFNEFCHNIEDSLIVEAATTGLKVAVTFVALVSFVIIVSSFLYFLWNKNKYIMLQKRNTFLLSLVFISFLMTIFGVSHKVLSGADNFSCRMLLIVVPVQFVLFMEANVGRLFSLLWRIRFNQQLIEETYVAMVGGELNLAVGSQSFVKRTFGKPKQESYYTAVLKDIDVENQKPKSYFRNIAICIYNFGVWFSPCLFYFLRWKPSKELPKRLQFSQFLASKTAAILVTSFFCIIFVVSIVYEAFVIIPRGQDCFGCPVEAAFNTAAIVLMIVTALFYFYVLFRLKDVPDSLGIKKELLVVGLLYVFLYFVAIGILRHAAPELEEKGQFDYAIVVIIGMAFAAYYKFAYQVRIAKRRAERNILDIESKLVEVIESTEGSQAFALYLASTLSLETLMFYKAANQWKGTYEKRNNTENIETARSIYEQFITTDAFMLINISGNSRKDIEDNLSEEIISQAIFDKASAEMFMLMSNDIFPRFIKSNYFKAYANELQH